MNALALALWACGLAAPLQGQAQPASPALQASAPTPASAPVPPAAIRWLLLDFVPYHVIDGPNKGTGLRDIYLGALAKRMPEYQHQLEVSSTERIAQFMQAGQPVCSLSTLKVPEREAYTRFGAEPYFMQLPPVLIVRRGYAPPGGWKKRPGGEVSLVELLRSGEVRVGTLPKRRYGQALDEALKQARTARPEQVLDFGEYGLLSGLLHTLSRKRFDVTLGYAIEVEQLRKHQGGLEDFQYLPLAESPPLIPTYAACSLTPWGKQVIQAIDRLPGMDAERSRLREQYESMLPPEERLVYRARMAAVAAVPSSASTLAPAGVLTPAAATAAAANASASSSEARATPR
ncbi:TIGR02285 family protein [Paucibacter sp. Y2R2-4]|uniref:TIGR02285 family protein n=1 Tax=Paucibacter sp. Y2R2-4 TaxID=2893553 RepID=UPI0021E35F7F|nr:TIGR02285 family protein [Paucibacter sp. Y2R2-4]MCV2350266.1 TIGR02285 family protein [Paucibacter sp. Y2R2-4]